VFLLLFLATAAATYYLEKQVLCEEATFSATAVVSWSAANSGPTPADPQRNALCPDAAGVEEEIRSVSAIARALDCPAMPHDSPPDATAIEDRAAQVSRIRKNLQVLVFEMPPGDFHATISCVDSTAEKAKHLVNCLAQQFVDERRAKSEQVSRQRWSATEKAMAQVWDRFARNRQTLAQAGTQMSSALAEYLPLHRAGVAAMEQCRRNLATSVSNLELSPANVEKTIPNARLSAGDDPRGVALQGELRELEHRLSELSATRTMSHPEVQEVQARMTAVRERLKAIPQSASLNLSSPEQWPVAVKRPTPSPPTDTRAEEALARVLSEKQSLDQAVEDLGRIAPPERQAANDLFSMPHMDCRLAEEAQGHSGEHLGLVLLITVAVALIITGGVGTIATGIRERVPRGQPRRLSTLRGGSASKSSRGRTLPTIPPIRPGLPERRHRAPA
jgi:hypothetical protein